MPTILSDDGIQFGATAARPQLFDLTTTQSGGALTTTAPPHTSVFRNATLSSGAPLVTRTSGTLTGTIPSGATLGAVTTVSARIAVLEFYNGGTSVLGWCNIGGGLLLDGTNLLSPTTISAGATSATTAYSASAVSASSPYRCIGYFDAVNTAGAWATPTLVHGDGTQMLVAMSSLGYGQTWQNVTGSRVVGTTYYNTTGRPISVNIVCSMVSGNTYPVLTIDGVAVSSGTGAGTTAYFSGTQGIVPVGRSYVLSSSSSSISSITTWSELR